MTLETFFEKFDQLAGLPDSVGKMREIVLQLAVRGRLAQQDSHESAKPQLEQSESFRVRRGRRGTPNSSDTPFPIPVNWGWVAVGDAMDMVNGKAFKPEDWSSEGTPIIRIQNLNNEAAAFNHCKKTIESRFCVNSGDFLISWSGTPGTSFGAFIWNRGFAYLNQHIFRCELVENVFVKEFLRLTVNARLDEMISHAQGGVGLRHITKGKLESIRLPLPPLAEQKRIVRKVDELMALCDRLEAQQQERADQHAVFASAAAARFAEVPSPTNISLLFHDSCAITPAELRNSIVALAVQGKLVAQNPSDEPATALLNRIAEERKLKAFKEYEPVMAQEKFYEIPSSWAWVCLGDIALGSDSGWSPQCLAEPRTGTEWGVLKVSAVSWGAYAPEENKALPPGMAARHECEIRPGDFLMSRANTEELVARSVVVDQTPPHLMMSDKIVRFRLSQDVDKGFVNLANSSVFARAYYARNASGTSSSMKNVSRETMCKLPVPLPPLAEQRRIITKVDQLMLFVDCLEVDLANTRTQSALLLDALVAELVS